MLVKSACGNIPVSMSTAQSASAARFYNLISLTHFCFPYKNATIFSLSRVTRKFRFPLFLIGGCHNTLADFCSLLGLRESFGV
jgi:hypothetical protein